MKKSNSGDNKSNGQRPLRVAEELRRLLAMILQRGETNESLLNRGLVTITEVRIGPDLRNATIFFMSLGGQDLDEVGEALQRAKPYLRSVVAKSLRLRAVPDFIFVKDPSFDQAARIHQILNDTK